jgi:hypothetical protein
MINPLCIATRGLLTGDEVAIATRGYICPGDEPATGVGGLRSPFRINTIEIARREDEELLVLIAAFLENL